MAPVPDEAELDPRWSTSTRLRVVAKRKSVAGPYDITDPDAPDEDGSLDFGSLRIPMPARAQLQVEKGSGELLRAVHVLVPSGRVSLSALAAPRSSPLWRELAEEIAQSLAGDGARVRSEWGEWGREVQAGSNGALSRFIGVDGPRWMLYGVATGPAEGAAELAHTLREMIRGTVVDRGGDPLPVKTVLPLRLPEHLEERVEEAREHTTLRAEADPIVRLDDPADDPRLEPERDPAPRPERRTWPEPEYGRGPAAGPGEPAGWGERPADGAPQADIHSAGGQGWEPEPVGRSIGFRRSDLRPVTRRPPAAHATGLPPVPATDSMDTDGIPIVETTWSMAIPVVSSEEVSHQPDWAGLSDAPSFWPRPTVVDEGPAQPYRPARQELDDLGFGLPPTGLDPLPGEPGGPPPGFAEQSPGFAEEPSGYVEAPPGFAEEPLGTPRPVEGPPHVADAAFGPPEELPPSYAEPLPASDWTPPAPPEQPPESTPEPTTPGEAGPRDSLLDALTSDAAVTRDRSRVQRRARHRRPD